MTLLDLTRRLLPAGLLCAATALTAMAPAAAADASPETVFDRYVAAVHAGDMDAVRSLIAPDVERSDFVGCAPAMDNPTCLTHYLRITVVEPKARLTVLRRQSDGDTVSADLEVRSPLCDKAGVQRIVGRDVLRVRGGLISAFRFVPDFGDEQTAVFFATLGIGPRAGRAPAKP
jgi:SnoaL-like domain